MGGGFGRKAVEGPASTRTVTHLRSEWSTSKAPIQRLPLWDVSRRLRMPREAGTAAAAKQMMATLAPRFSDVFDGGARAYGLRWRRARNGLRSETVVAGKVILFSNAVDPVMPDGHHVMDQLRVQFLPGTSLVCGNSAELHLRVGPEADGRLLGHPRCATGAVGDQP